MPAPTTSSIGLFASDYKAISSRSKAQWQQAARSFDVLIGMPAVYGPELPTLRAANHNVSIFFYNIGPYVVSPSPAYQQVENHETWFAHDTKGQRVYVTGISHPNGTMYLMEQSNAQWRSWEASQVTAVFKQYGFDGVDVDNMGWGATQNYTDQVPVNPATHKKYTTDQWLQESVQTLNAIKAAVGTKFVMFNGLTTGADYSVTKILATSKADGGMAEEFLRGATSPITKYPTAAVWLENLQMMTDMASRGKYFFAWTKTWTNGTSAQIAAWNTYAEATYLLGKGTHSYYDFLPTTSTSRIAVPYSDEEAALGSAKSAYTVSGGVYKRVFQHGTVTVNPSTDQASITVT
jgi:hypothetical protein